MADPLAVDGTADDEDFICIIKDGEAHDLKPQQQKHSNQDDLATFELLDAANLKEDHFTEVKLTPPENRLLFPPLSSSSILGTKSSNISLNIDTSSSLVTAGETYSGDDIVASSPPISARSYSAESLTFFGDDTHNRRHLSNATTLNDKERKSSQKSSSSFKSISLSTSSTQPATLLNSLAAYENLQQWIYCIAVVNFDIEIGQSIECLFPNDAHLTERETSNICYLSFPDSNSGCMGDTQFHFRTRTCPPNTNSRLKRASFERHRYLDFNASCLQVLQVEEEYLHGYVYFRQVRDQASKRGYFQKSLVVLSWFPFVPLFSKVLKVLAPRYFELDMAALEAACSDINRWPSPTTGQILTLPLLGSVLQVLLPDEKYNYASMCQPSHHHHHHRHSFNHSLKKYSTAAAQTLSLRPLSLLKLRRASNASNKEVVDEGGDKGGGGAVENSSSTTEVEENDNNTLEADFGFQHLGFPGPESSPSRNLVVNVVTDINIYRALLPVIAHVQLLWELVLTCEPVAVITQSPSLCSEVVHALVHTISPLKYGSDWRPFFTIHDSEFKEYASSQTRSPPPVILGVTNPFFVKTLAEWPHLIKISDFVNDDDSTSTSTSTPATSIKVNSSTKKTNPSLVARSLELKTGVYTKYKPFLSKDREILKKLLRGIDSARPAEAQNALLRRFFIELTQSFLIPLERYFASLMPLARNLSPFKRPPVMAHFRIENFIGTLDATGPQLTTGIKGDWTGLYRRFLRSPNYVAWYNARMAEATDKLRALHIEAIADANLARLVVGKPEVEIVDLILKLQENIRAATAAEAAAASSLGNNSSSSNSNGTFEEGKGTMAAATVRLSTSTVDRLKANLRAIVDVLPEDSRALFAGGEKMLI